MKKNLLFLIWSPSYGGAERLVLNIVKNLDKSRYNISVFSDSPERGPLQQEFEKAGAKVFYSPCNQWKHPRRYMKAVKHVIETQKIDIIHAHNDQNMILALLAKPKNVKFIAHAHNTDFHFTRSKTISNISTRLFSKHITKHVDARLSCGVEAGNATFLGKSFTVIPNGTEIEKFKFNKEQRKKLRTKYNTDGKTTVLLNVGRLIDQKNHAFLIDVFNEYQKMHPNSKLIIIGDGYLKEALQDKIAQLELNDKIILLPSQNNIAEYYNIADLFIMTSLYEGMPYVTVEAQANGLKCVFSNTISKEADHSKDSLFLSLKNSPKKWAEDISKLDLKRKDSRFESVKPFDIKGVVGKIDEIYYNI